MTPQDIFIGIPTRGEPNFNLVRQLFKLVRTHQLPRDPVFYGERLESHEARHRLIDMCLNTDAQALLMLDDDVVPPHNVFDLIEQWRVTANVGVDELNKSVPLGIFAGVYLTPRIDMVPIPCVFMGGENGYRVYPSPFGQTQVVECDAVGAGCLLIPRYVLEHPALVAPFEPIRDERGRRVLTDDFSFCLRVKAVGFRIWADFGVYCDHMMGTLSLAILHQRYGEAITRGMAKTFQDVPTPRIVVPEC